MLTQQLDKTGSAMPPCSILVAETECMNPGSDNQGVIELANLLASRMKALCVDPKLEEKQLQAVIDVLHSFAKDNPNPISELPLANTSLPVSTTEWQVLNSGSVAKENSFRGELHRTVSRSLGLLASLQEELALYRVRRNTAHLFKKHLSSLFYLAHEALVLMPDLEGACAGASSRGLTTKAEQLRETLRRMGEIVEQITKLNVPESDGNPRILRCDPKWIDSMVQEVIYQLIDFARGASQPAGSIPLRSSELSVTPTELQALATVCASEDRSFRANLHRVLRRTTGLRAVMQEELALYNSRRESKYEWKRHLESLRYLSASALDILPELEALSEECKRRSLFGKFTDLQQTIERVRERTVEISTIR